MHCLGAAHIMTTCMQCCHTCQQVFELRGSSSIIWVDALPWCSTHYDNMMQCCHICQQVFELRGQGLASFGLSFGLNFAHICCVYSISTFAQLLFCVQHIAMCLFNYLSEGLLCLLCFFLCWAHTHIVSCQHVWPFHICDTCVHRQIEKTYVNMQTRAHATYTQTCMHTCRIA